MKNSIKLLICYHKSYHLLEDDILTPIHVGRATARKNPNHDEGTEWLLSNMIGDDTGDNISHKNHSYNELTAIYWAWKNYNVLGNPDYVGFMHYRRHFVFEEMKNRRTIHLDSIDEHYYNLINYSRKTVHRLISRCDILYHEGKVDSIRGHYAENHDVEDLDYSVSILEKTHPEYTKTAYEFLNGSRGCFNNMFIASRKIFFEYCEWLFSILEIFEKNRNLTEKRLFISERLTGIFIQQKINEGIRAKKLPITFIKKFTDIPIVLPWNDDVFSIATSILSHVSAIKNLTNYIFYIIGNPDSDSVVLLKRLSEEYRFSIVFLVPCQHLESLMESISGDPYPLILHCLMPDIDKCIYTTEYVCPVQDWSEFYCTCNVDDYWIRGIPKGSNDPFDKEKKVSYDLLVLNLNKLRTHEIHKRYDNIVSANSKESEEVLRIACENNIGYISSRFYQEVSKTDRVYIDEYDLKRTHIIHYNGCHPKISMQEPYSILWWENALKVPGYIPFEFVSTDAIMSITRNQRSEAASRLYKSKPFLKRNKYDLIRELRLKFQTLVSIFNTYGFRTTIVRISEHFLEKIR